MAAPRNEAERSALEKFKASTKYEELSDGVLMRYLRARELNLTRAEEAITASLEWKLNRIEKQSFSCWKPPPEFQSTFKVYFTGLDKDGRVVLYINFDEWLPLRGLFEKYKPAEILIFAYYVLADIHRRVAHSKEQQLVCIWDNAEIGFSKIFHEVQNWAEIQTLREVVQMMDLNFPETLYKAFFINTARAVVYGFSLIKPFLRPYTIAKILIHGPDESTWMPLLREYLSDDLIPVNLGGSAELTNSLYDYVR